MAVTTLQGASLTPVVNCQVNADPTQAGLVQSQSPQGGVTVPTGSTVNIFVNQVSCAGG